MSRPASEAAQFKRSVADAVTRTLETIDYIDAVILFGSVARGDAAAASDIDLLIVVDTEPDPGGLRREVKRTWPHYQISLACRTREQMSELLRRRNSFAAHLHSEGLILLDRNQTMAAFQASTFSHCSVATELEEHLRRLLPLQDLRQFGGYFPFCFARLYSIAKSIVILGLHQSGEAEFDRTRAFTQFAQRHSDLLPKIELLTQLEPYYEQANRGSRSVLPKPYEGPVARDRALHAIMAIKDIARAV